MPHDHHDRHTTSVTTAAAIFISQASRLLPSSRHQCQSRSLSPSHHKRHNCYRLLATSVTIATVFTPQVSRSPPRHTTSVKIVAQSHHKRHNRCTVTLQESRSLQRHTTSVTIVAVTPQASQ
ncbi:hypothetical protein BaRGS_00020424 [Batillaria attramentaria]|uniref:Uncharacterized protein n=1 Tax=Batillaria attramentaria TaxID=370345 RepID=A0ABD0KM22_9CAEN